MIRDNLSACPFLLNISGVLACTWLSFSCWTFRLSCLVPGNWAMSADTLSACPFPVEHFGCPILYLEIELWVQTPCQLVFFLLNILGVLSCTWKLSYECRHPVSLSYFCWTFRVSCLVPGNWAMSADTLSACPFLVEHFGYPVLYLEIELWVQTPCQLVLFATQQGVFPKNHSYVVQWSNLHSFNSIKDFFTFGVFVSAILAL